VKILGRKKDVFNTPTGNNIFPARMEGMLEQIAGVHQAVLIGDARPFLTALLVLEPGANVADIGREVRAINTRLEGEEQVRRWCVVEPPLATDLYRPVGHGKVRRERKLIEERFADAVAALYAARPTPAITIVEH
jgi:phenylacetate-coenzyme A ligase PaaK-like adenylate-forming protein